MFAIRLVPWVNTRKSLSFGKYIVCFRLLSIVLFSLTSFPGLEKRLGNEVAFPCVVIYTHCKDSYNTIPVHWHTWYMEYQVCREAVQLRYRCKKKWDHETNIKYARQSFSFFADLWTDLPSLPCLKLFQSFHLHRVVDHRCIHFVHNTYLWTTST